jgi:hypothetical protein
MRGERRGGERQEEVNRKMSKMENSRRNNINFFFFLHWGR